MEIEGKVKRRQKEQIARKIRDGLDPFENMIENERVMIAVTDAMVKLNEKISGELECKRILNEQLMDTIEKQKEHRCLRETDAHRLIFVRSLTSCAP
jgi:hypothetical protein